MENKELTNPQNLQIQGLIDSYLRSQNARNNQATAFEKHLDEDSLTAFTEGNVTEREAPPIVKHLVACSFCRHVTAELVKLDLAFNEGAVAVTAIENQPSKVSEVLSNLLSRIFGTNDEAVFAHQEKEETEDDEKKSDESK